jgi:hypothetical protein
LESTFESHPIFNCFHPNGAYNRPNRIEAGNGGCAARLVLPIRSAPVIACVTHGCSSGNRISNMSKLATISLRLVPVLMQIFGLVGIAFGGWYSVVIVMGSGIGNPAGVTQESVYTTAGWLVGVPALVFLIGWVWVIIGFLSRPVATAV